MPPMNKTMKQASSLRPCTTRDTDLNKRMHDCEIEAVTTTITSRFEDLNLSPELIKGLYEEMKFEGPSDIQSISLPIILTPPYKNLFAEACSVSGKTTCLVLAMLTRVDPNLSATQALCLCTTPKDAIQIMEVIQKMESYTGITSQLCSKFFPDSEIAPLTAQLIVGSPGTVSAWIARDKLDTSNLKILVFDDAHFMPAVDSNNYSVRIMKEISPKCQVIVFSNSVLSDEYLKKAYVSTILKDVEFHQLFVDEEEEPLSSFDSVKQYNVNVLDGPSKITVIKDKIMGLGDGVRQTVIYVETRESAEILQKAFFKDGYAVTTVLDTITRKEELKINKEFKDGLIQVLIATSALSRNFDLSQVNLAINYEVPIKFRRLPDHEAYLRRLGRARQFGRKAAVFNLICGDEDHMFMEKIARHSNYHVTELPSPPSDDDFKDALKKAGLMGITH